MKTKFIITNLKQFFKHDFDMPFYILADVEQQLHETVKNGLKENYNIISSDNLVYFELDSFTFKNGCYYFYYSFKSTAQ
jgi:hypothetical protein